MSELKSIETYIKQFNVDTQEKLRLIASIIEEEAPNATQAIKYGIPTWVFYGNLVHIAAFKKHIGFYPTPTAISTFAEELIDFNYSKGTIQFPLDQPIPEDLIRRIIQFRVKEVQS